MKKQPVETPDEATLTLWMDGELNGDELARMESWAQDHPELLAERDAVQAMSVSIKAHVPASVEPPYPDFFNQRILRHIDDELLTLPVKETGTRQSFLRKMGSWLAFPAAAAAMAVCFYMGTQLRDGSARDMPAISVAAGASVYTPDSEVSAAMFNSKDAGATVIVLEGLEDIPDDFDIAGEPHRGRYDQPGAMMVTTEMVF